MQRGADGHVVVVDFAAALRSKFRDVPNDAQWFSTHPHEAYRVRPPSADEVAGWDLAPTSVVLVVRLPDGTPLRMFDADDGDVAELVAAIEAGGAGVIGKEIKITGLTPGSSPPPPPS